MRRTARRAVSAANEEGTLCSNCGDWTGQNDERRVGSDGLTHWSSCPRLPPNPTQRNESDERKCSECDLPRVEGRSLCQHHVWLWENNAAARDQRARAYPTKDANFKQDVWTAWREHHVETGHDNFDSDDEYAISCRDCREDFFADELEDSVDDENSCAVRGCSRSREAGNERCAVCKHCTCQQPRLDQNDEDPRCPVHAFPYPAVRAVEAVDHPAHYGGAENPYEVIKVIEAWGLGFSLGNAVKCISRAGKKDPSKEVEDLKKALLYLNHRIATLEKSSADT